MTRIQWQVSIQSQGNPGEDYAKPSATSKSLWSGLRVCIGGFIRSPLRQKQRDAVSPIPKRPGWIFDSEVTWCCVSPESSDYKHHRACCAEGGCISALSLRMAVPAARPARWCVRPHAGSLLPRDHHCCAWQMRWDFTTKFPAKRPNSQSVCLLLIAPKEWHGFDRVFPLFKDIFNANWLGNVRFMKLLKDIHRRLPPTLFYPYIS